MLKNVTAEEVAAFRRNIELVSLAGEENSACIAEAVARCESRNPGVATGTGHHTAIKTEFIDQGEPLVLDPAGYFVIYPEERRSTLVLEHYAKDGVLDEVLEGHSATALFQAAASRKLVSRLDHAAYLGRELARAEQSLRDGTRYVQDSAPEPEHIPTDSSCGCREGSCQ